MDPILVLEYLPRLNGWKIVEFFLEYLSMQKRGFSKELFERAFGQKTLFFNEFFMGPMRRKR